MPQGQQIGALHDRHEKVASKAAPVLTRDVLRDELAKFAEGGLRSVLEETAEEIKELLKEAATGGANSGFYNDAAAPARMPEVKHISNPSRKVRRRSRKLNELTAAAEAFESIPLIHDWMKRSPRRNHTNDLPPFTNRTSVILSAAEEALAAEELAEVEPDSPRSSWMTRPADYDHGTDSGVIGDTSSVRSLLLQCCAAETPRDPESTPETNGTEENRPRLRRRKAQHESQDPELKSMLWFHIWVHNLQLVVDHHLFEYWTAFLIVLNSAMIGIETELLDAPDSIWKEVCIKGELVFCILFSIEMTLRLTAHGRLFLYMETWMWNVFDLSVTIVQVIEQISLFLNCTYGSSFTRMFRTLRLVRITRLVRMFHLVDELQKIVSSIIGSLDSLGWVLTLLFLIIYLFSVLFTQLTMYQILAAGGDDAEEVKDLAYWFGSVPRTALTLFESVFGGLSWDQQATLLINRISPWAGVLYCLYVAFCLVALMNVITGVFVDKALHLAQAEADSRLVRRVNHLFSEATAKYGQIEWDMFQELIESETMMEYFKAINIDPSEARGLFDLLDCDCSGGVDCDEIVNGLLRLRGSAGALETSLLLREVSHMCQRLDISIEHQLQLSRDRLGLNSMGVGSMMSETDFGGLLDEDDE
eukprot:TRINITY_DN10417_c0_g1_i1.p1 TRINITY_DN10417_c0_g1~~TRINITY_DN10417_c0_g1_i1.p1  ORF type:complete len:645 (-),score=116.32 TRINITY_DN10417_c0_g1_i1:346-2280(-)